MCSQTVDISTFQCISDALLCIHCNVNGLKKHIHDVETMLSCLPRLPSVLAISETRLQSVECPSLKLTEYNSYFSCREGRGGGVALYVRSDYVARERNDLKFRISDDLLCESLFLEIEGGAEGDTTIVGVFYRQPKGNPAHFVTSLETLLSRIGNRKSIILGDANLNTMAESVEAQELIETLEQFCYKEVVNVPTRVATTIRRGTAYNTSTCIDHIYTNVQTLSLLASGALTTTFSDHHATFISVVSKRIGRPASMTYKYNYDQILAELAITNWNDLYDISDVDEAFACFNERVMAAVTRGKREIRQKLNKGQPRKPWVTAELLEMIKEKEAAYTAYRSDPNARRRQAYVRLRNKVVSFSRKCRLEANGKIVCDRIQERRSPWEAIQPVMGGAQEKKCVKLKIDDEIVTDCVRLSNILNDYYATCVTADTECSAAYEVPMSIPELHEPFSPRPVPVDRVHYLLKRVTICSVGEGHIPSQVLRHCADVIADAVAFIVNLSTRQGIYPTALKLYRVVPLFKGGDRLSKENYRPVSIPPPMSKIFEKAIYEQLNEHFEMFNGLSQRQFGFRSKMSTTVPIMDFVEEVRRNLMLKKTVAGVFIDLRKAFDTVDVNILIKKLTRYGADDIFCLGCGRLCRIGGKLFKWAMQSRM